MKTVRRLLYADVLGSVGFVALAFLALFFFLDLVEALRDIGRNGYTLRHAVAYCVLQLPGHLYELGPITVLIGSIYSLSRMAQSSEFTILRTSGLGPGRALALLGQLGLLFALLTFAVGDGLAPMAERQGARVQAVQSGGYGLDRAGAWLKERRMTPDGPMSVSVNVGAASADGALRDVRIFEFDADGRLVRRLSAERARIDREGSWQLESVTATEWPRAKSAGPAPSAEPVVRLLRFETLAWPTTLQAGLVAAAVMPENTMGTLELFQYIQHLETNEQAALNHEIAFWRRALYPFACLVMVALALPFAYLHARAGSTSLKVFGGILLGISFVLMNNVAAHLGLLRGWIPWIVAAAPSGLYLALSLVAFALLVRFR